MTFNHSRASELAQLMESTSPGALIPEIVLRAFRSCWRLRFLPCPPPSSMSADPMNAPRTAIANEC
jgi:hypothetical protein